MSTHNILLFRFLIHKFPGFVENMLKTMQKDAGLMMEKGYLHENPVEGIKNLREEAKHRDALSEDELAQMKAHLIEKGEKHFLLACMMEYYTFIRPEELTCLMVGDILVKEQKILRILKAILLSSRRKLRRQQVAAIL